MGFRSLVIAGALIIAITAITLIVLPTDAQTPASSGPNAPTFAAGGFTPPASSYAPPRTPWGDPDLQGIYDFQTIIRMQRPLDLAGKKTFTEEELKAWAQKNTPNE